MTPSLIRRLKSNQGSALIAVLLISLLLLSGMAWFSQWTQVRTRGDVHQVNLQRAKDQADSGIELAMQNLRQPQLLPFGTTLASSTTFPNGRGDVFMVRNSSDTNLIDVVSTAYAFAPNGTMEDPITHRRAQRAVVNSKIRLHYIGNYFAVVPDTLKISYGSDLSGGNVYARSLIFESGPGGGSSTRVGSAFYTDTMDPSPTPSFVVFTSSPTNGQKLPSTPNLIHLGASTESYYRGKATVAESQLGPGNNTLATTVAPPVGNLHKVYFCDGDLHLGTATQPLIISGIWVVYATGNIYIHNSVQASGTDWAGFLAHGSIHVAGDAPNTIVINGNFVTNGALIADPPTNPVAVNRPTGNLTFVGGFLAHEGVNFVDVYKGSRTYAYRTSLDPTLLLPNFTELLEFKITQGKTK